MFNNSCSYNKDTFYKQTYNFKYSQDVNHRATYFKWKLLYFIDSYPSYQNDKNLVLQ